MYKLFAEIEQWQLKIAVVLSVMGTLTLIATALLGMLVMFGLISMPN